jgi:hypothetical protein
MAHSLRSPNSIASYSAMLLVHLSVSLVNYNRLAYLNFMSEGDIRTAAAPTPILPHALSQYTCHGMSTTRHSV